MAQDIDFGSMDPITVTLNVPELQPNAVHDDVMIETCISIACRNSEARILRKYKIL